MSSSIEQKRRQHLLVGETIRKTEDACVIGVGSPPPQPRPPCRFGDRKQTDECEYGRNRKQSRSHPSFRTKEKRSGFHASRRESDGRQSQVVVAVGPVFQSEAVADRRKGEKREQNGERENRQFLPRRNRECQKCQEQNRTGDQDCPRLLPPLVAAEHGEPAERPEPAREVLPREPRRRDNELPPLDFREAAVHHGRCAERVAQQQIHCGNGRIRSVSHPRGTRPNPGRSQIEVEQKQKRNECNGGLVGDKREKEEQAGEDDLFRTKSIAVPSCVVADHRKRRERDHQLDVGAAKPGRRRNERRGKKPDGRGENRLPLVSENPAAQCKDGKERSDSDCDSHEAAGVDAERRHRDEKSEQQVLDRPEQAEHVGAEQGSGRGESADENKLLPVIGRKPFVRKREALDDHIDERNEEKEDTMELFEPVRVVCACHAHDSSILELTRQPTFEMQARRKRSGIVA